MVIIAKQESDLRVSKSANTISTWPSATARYRTRRQRWREVGIDRPQIQSVVASVDVERSGSGEVDRAICLPDWNGRRFGLLQENARGPNSYCERRGCVERPVLGYGIVLSGP